MDNEQRVALIQAGENEAENMLKLWEQNRGFIAKIARKYSAVAELEDLEQEGYISLCEAVRHYRPEEGASFIHYAAFWIKQGMRRYIDECCRTVRLPSYAVDEVRRYKKISGEYLKYYGHEPAEREMSALLHVGREKLDRIKKAASMGRIESLSEPVPGTDGLTIEESVADERDMEEETVRAVDRENMSRELWLAVDELPDKQAGAIRLRFIDGVTLKELGERLGVTTERARGVQDKAVKTLRQRAHRYKYRHYFEEYLAAAPVRHVGVQRFRETWTSEVEMEAIRWAEKELGYV